MVSKKLFCLLGIFVLIFGNVNFALAGKNIAPTFGEDILNSLASPAIVGKDSSTLFEGIQITDDLDFVEIYFLFEGWISNDFLIFENIKPALVSNHTTFIKINKTSEEIIGADFTVYVGQNFIFGNNQFYLPANSRVIFEGKTIKIQSGEGAVFDKLPSILNPDFLFKGLEIEGKNIQLPNDMKIVEGKVNIGINGVLIESGKVISKNKLFTVADGAENVLIANRNMPGYEGNFVSDLDNYFFARSSETGLIDIEFLAENDLMKIEEGDKLKMQVMRGDSLEILPGANIPIINHYSSENGESRITNGNLGTFVYSKDDLMIEKGNEYLLEKDGGPVSMNIVSDSPEINLDLEINEEGEVSLFEGGYLVNTFNKNLSEKLDGFSLNGLKKTFGENWKFELRGTAENIMKNTGAEYKYVIELMENIENLPVQNQLLFGENSQFLSAEYFNDLKETGMSSDQSVKLVSTMVENVGKDISSPLMYSLVPAMETTIENGKTYEESLEIINDVLILSNGDPEILLQDLSILGDSQYQIEESLSILEKLKSKAGRDSVFISKGPLFDYLSLAERNKMDYEEISMFTDSVLLQTSYGDVWSAFDRGIPEAIELGKEKGFSEKEILNIIADSSSNLNTNQLEVKNLFLKYANPSTDSRNIATQVYNNGRYTSEYYALSQNVEEEYGLPPMRSLPNLARYVDYQEDLISSAKDVGISPYLLYAAAEQESFIYFLSVEPYSAEGRVDHNLGLNNFYDVQEVLIERGYMDASLRDVGLDNNKNMLAVMASELSWFKEDYLIPDLRRNGIDPNSLSESQMDWWTYLYYNSGPGNGARWLKESGINFMYEGKNIDWEKRDSSERIKNVHHNAARVAGAAEIARELGVFKNYN